MQINKVVEIPYQLMAANSEHSIIKIDMNDSEYKEKTACSNIVCCRRRAKSSHKNGSEIGTNKNASLDKVFLNLYRTSSGFCKAWLTPLIMNGVANTGTFFSRL